MAAAQEEIWLSVGGAETRVAVVEQGEIQAIHIQRESQQTLVGNIYSARVIRVMPDLQAAFVDLGSTRHGFLALADLARNQPLLSKVSSTKSAGVADFLYQGQKLLVQVTKDPVGNKGARLTAQISISSRYLVYSPGSVGVGVSRAITDSDERQRIRQLLLDAGKSEALVEGVEGFILRTASRAATAQDIADDLHFLSSLWVDVLQRSKLATDVTLAYCELPLSLRVLRDLVGTSTQKIVVYCHSTFLILESFCQSYMPELLVKLMYRAPDTAQASAREQAIDTEIGRALNRQVDLPGGGYLVFDHTEAMTVVDVNSGSALGTSANYAAQFEINKEAVRVLARQLRLRNIGGIIVVDFIDMKEPKHRRDLVSLLRQCTAADVAMGKIAEISKLGLVEMTRKRSSQSLLQLMCEECAQCGGRGHIKSPATIGFEILRKLQRWGERDVVVMASASVVEYVVSEQAIELEKLRESRQINFRVAALSDPELFEFAVL